MPETVTSTQIPTDLQNQEPAPIPPPLSGVSATSEPVAPEPPEALPTDKPQDVVEKIVPQVAPVERTLKYEDVERTYTQRPLSYFRKIEFFGLVGSTLEEILESGVNLDSIFGDVAPGSVEDFRSAEIGELSTFVAAVAKIAGYAPEFVKKAYLIILNVPHNEKAFAFEALDSIDDDTGEDILITFIDQNYKELESFFTERFRKVLDRAQNLRNQD